MSVEMDDEAMQTYERAAVAAGASQEIKNDPAGSRTRDLRIKSPLLYQLSYRVR